MKTCISCGESYENRIIMTEPYCQACCTAPWCTECEDILDFCEHYEREMATLRVVEKEKPTVHCWMSRDDGCTCMALQGHDGPHDWVSDRDIRILFAPRTVETKL